MQRGAKHTHFLPIDSLIFSPSRTWDDVMATEEICSRLQWKIISVLARRCLKLDKTMQFNFVNLAHFLRLKGIRDSAGSTATKFSCTVLDDTRFNNFAYDGYLLYIDDDGEVEYYVLTM